MTVMTKKKDVASLDNEQIVSKSLTQKAIIRIRRDKLTMIALGILLLLTVISLLAPFITDTILQVDPNQTNPRENFLPIGTPGHILGTDDIGRDHLARLLHATGVSMAIGVFGAIFTISIGLVLGLITGYYGGIVDDGMNWIVTTIDSIPALFLLILFSFVFSPSAETLILVIAMISWTSTLRLIRGQTFALREQEYIIAANALGARPFQVMFRHMLPNLVSILIISLAITIAGLILAESALSYLGVGVQPPQATLGNMLTKSQQFFRLGPHLVILPGLIIFVIGLCLYIVGDGIRDAFDPTAND